MASVLSSGLVHISTSFLTEDVGSGLSDLHRFESGKDRLLTDSGCHEIPTA